MQVETTAPFWEGLRFERDDLVLDGAILTAQPWAYRQFAAVVARELGVLTPQEAADLAAHGAPRRKR